VLNESFEPLDAQRELAKRQRALSYRPRSRPRHFTAGCSRPREPVATKASGFTTALFAARGEALPPSRGRRFAAGIVEIDHVIRRSHQQGIEGSSAYPKTIVDNCFLAGEGSRS
jgi:hypothetical protein